MRLRTFVLAMLLAVVLAAPAVSHVDDLEPYLGLWVGESVAVEKPPQGAPVTARRLDLVIRPSQSGFDMTWTPFGRGAAGKIKAQFEAAREPHLFTLKTADPPLNGSEALEARIEAEGLVVRLSSRGDDGSETLASYVFSVSGRRMTLTYTLSRGGEVLESLKGQLSRAKVVL